MGHAHRRSLVLLSAAAVFAGSVPALAQSPGTSGAPAMSMDELVAAAQAEGTLSTIALARDWCNYGAAIDAFKAKYGIAVNELNPTGGLRRRAPGHHRQQGQHRAGGPGRHRRRSRVRPAGDGAGPAPALQGQHLGQHPRRGQGPGRLLVRRLLRRADVRDQHRHRAQPAQGLGGPAQAGVQGPGRAVGRPERLHPGDRRRCYASALANGGSLDDAAPRARRSGSRSWTRATSCRSSPLGATVDQGETPITIRWNYNALANRDQAEADSGTVIDVAVPASGPFGGVYVQGISAYAPHPNAAKLWQEYLYSDEGQNICLERLLLPDPLRGHEGGRHARRSRCSPSCRTPPVRCSPRSTSWTRRPRSSPIRPRAGTRWSARSRSRPAPLPDGD